MKKYLLSLLTLTLLFCEASFTGGGMAFATPASLGNGVTWELDGTTLTIGYTGEGSGVMPTYSSGSDASRPWNSDKASITDIVVEEGITVIGAYAFHGCTAATNVSLPSTLDSIGYNVFQSLTTSCATTFHGTIEKWCSVGMKDYDSNPFYKGDKKFRTDAGIITTLTIPQGVTQIKPYVFRGTTITKLTIPTSVTVIGGHAFRDCSSLSSVTFNATSTVDSIATYAFGSSALTTIAIPSSVRVIETRAFDACSSLKTIDFNNASKLKTIGTYAFYGTTGLTTLSLRGATSLVTIKNSAFSVSSANTTAKSYLYLPASLRTIEANAFNNRTGLEGIVIMNTNTTDNLTKCSATTCFPAALSGIPVYVYNSSVQSAYSELTEWSTFTNYTTTNTVTFNCGTPTASSLVASLNIRTGSLTFTGSGDMKDYTSTKADWKLDVYKSVLKSVTISKMSRIGAYAFYNCDNLTGSISIPNTVVSIGNSAFYGCKGLTGLTLSSASKLETIDQYAFKDCSKITSSFSATGWGGKVSTIGNYAFSGCGLTAVALPSTLTSLGNYAFQNNKSLTKADFSAATSLTTFGTYMFSGCSALSNVTLQSTLTALPDRTFYSCSSLKTVSLPESVASIGGSYVFASSGIKTIIANRSTTPTLSSAMSGINPDTIRLAVFTAAAKTAYKAHTYWGQFDIDTKIEGECGADGDNVMYALDLATGVLTLTGSGATATYSTSDANRAPWYAYRSLITSAVVENGITGIGGYAFKECASMTTISLPETLATMGSSVFDGCTSLASYTYAGTIEQWLGITFSGTSSTPMYHVKKLYANGSDTEITNLVIPNGTTTIPNYAFYNCQGLVSVTLPASLSSVGTSAFSTCTHIANTNYLGTIDQWCGITFAGNVSNPAFFSQKLSINGVEQTDIYLSDELAEIKNYAFESNATLASVSVKNSTTIHADAFKNCDATITVRGELNGTCGTGLNWSLEDGVLTISYSSGTGVMDDYTSSKAPWYVYRKSINKIIVGEGVTQVSKYAFRGMTQTFGVYLPSTLTQIGDYGFYESSGLSYIVSKATTPPSIPAHIAGYSSYESGTFASVATDIPVYVPLGSESAYASAMTITYSTSTGWKRFTNYIPTIVFTGNCGTTGHESEVTWTYDPADRSMTISGSGDMKDYGSSSAAPWNTLKPLIASVVIEDGVTKGGKYAFDNCTALTSISIATSCTSFGMQIFGGCTALTEVELPEGITVTGSWMFHGCTNLVNVTLPSTLTEVEVRTFSQTGITSIDIPEGVTNIDNYAFFQCASLASVGIPSTLARVSSSAFEDCSSLASIDLPEGLTYIGSEAFAGCSSLESITIPRTVTTVYTSSNSYTFQDCSALRTVNWNAEACADFNKYNSGSGFTYYTPFGNAKTTITAINFGEHVRIIPSCLCQGMTALTSVSLPASVQQIHQDAFNGCTGLTSITIPANVTTMQGTVFENCTGLTSVATNALTPPTIQTTTFPSEVESSATLTVPYNPTSRRAYSDDSYWSEFAHILPYILTFDLQGHGADIDEKCVVGRVDEELKPVDPTEDYYNFGGWYQEAGCNTPFTFGESGTAVNADKTIYAKWTIYNYQVTFDLQGHGSSIAAQTIDHGGLVSKPADPLAEHYIFGGWYKEAGCSNAWDFSEDHVTSATTLYAKWTLEDLTLNDNADNSDALTEYDGESTNVNLTRSLIAASYNTICLPFAMTEAQVETYFGANCDIEELTRASYADGNLKLFFTKRTAIEAGKPYLIQPQSDVANPTIAGVTIDNTSRPSEFEGVTFTGIFSPTALADSENLLFLGASNTLYMSSGGQMKGMRGYFELTTPGSQAAARRSARIILHEEGATGIESQMVNGKCENGKFIKDGQLFILRDGKTYNAQGALIK